MKNWKKTVIWFIVLAVLLGGGYWYWSFRQKVMQMMQGGPMGGMQGPMPLPVASCVKKDVTESLEFTGATEAVEHVEIRARVEGFLKAIHFTDGAVVEKDQLLFTIEPEAFAARRDEAAAMLETGKSELERTQFDYERLQKAAPSGAVSQQDLTRAQSAYNKASASLNAFQALLDKAALDLSYTEIRSPIRGRISRRLVDVGNLVGAESKTVLTTVVRTSPIYVSFYAAEHLLGGTQALRRLRGGDSAEPLMFEIALPNDETPIASGVLNFVDNSVDPKTGTVYVRGETANADESLLPGMFVRVRVPTGVLKDAVCIPEKAIQTDLGGKYVLVVGPGNVLQRRDLKLGQASGKVQVVKQGLDGSEQILVGGFAMARPGMPITPVTEDAPPQKP